MDDREIKVAETQSVHVDDLKPATNGFAIHAEQERTPEEKKIEKRLLLKIDFLILPVLALVYFLASMVNIEQPNSDLMC